MTRLHSLVPLPSHVFSFFLKEVSVGRGKGEKNSVSRIRTASSYKKYWRLAAERLGVEISLWSPGSSFLGSPKEAMLGRTRGQSPNVVEEEGRARLCRVGPMPQWGKCRAALSEWERLPSNKAFFLETDSTSALSRHCGHNQGQVLPLHWSPFTEQGSGHRGQWTLEGSLCCTCHTLWAVLGRVHQVGAIFSSLRRCPARRAVLRHLPSALFFLFSCPLLFPYHRGPQHGIVSV